MQYVTFESLIANPRILPSNAYPSSDDFVGENQVGEPPVGEM
jgi:hypothetical protein